MIQVQSRFAFFVLHSIDIFIKKVCLFYNAVYYEERLYPFHEELKSIFLSVHRPTRPESSARHSDATG